MSGSAGAACWLFAYGTLRVPRVQLAVFGRRLSQARDSLAGFATHRLVIADASGRGAAYLILRRAHDPLRRVPGVALKVTPADLARADAYEGPLYRRIEVELDSGRSAFVYVDARDPEGAAGGGELGSRT